MTRKRTHIALRYALLGSVVFAVSCTTSSISTPSFSPTAALQNVEANNVDGEATARLPDSTTIVPSGATETAEQTVEALALNPEAPSTAVAALAPAEPVTEVKTDVVETATTTAADATTEAVEPAKTEAREAIETAVAAEPERVPAPAKPKTGFFARSNAKPTGIFAFFQKKQEEKVTKAVAEETQIAAVSAPEEPKAEKTTRIITGEPKPRAEVKKPTVMRALPGVKSKNIFGISQATDAAKKIGQEVTRPVQLASASIGSAARSVANGIRTQTDRVSVKCFRPELVKMIKRIERHYGKPVVVTSGYRSPKRNRRAGGSKKSLHMYCAAADVQIKGVSKWALAKYIRSMPGRGGVGTYCHTKSVHLDIGSKRDWNWRCRRK